MMLPSNFAKRTKRGEIIMDYETPHDTDGSGRETQSTAGSRSDAATDRMSIGEGAISSSSSSSRARSRSGSSSSNISLPRKGNFVYEESSDLPVGSSQHVEAKWDSVYGK